MAKIPIVNDVKRQKRKNGQPAYPAQFRQMPAEPPETAHEPQPEYGFQHDVLLQRTQRMPASLVQHGKKRFRGLMLCCGLPLHDGLPQHFQIVWFHLLHN